MGHTHGNCANWTEQSATHVLCKEGSMIECWYSKNGNACKCHFWKPRVTELHLTTRLIVAEFYADDKTPIAVIAHCSDGKKYIVQPTHVIQARAAGWTYDSYNYIENEVRHYRQTWHGNPMNIVVVSSSQI